MKGSLLIVFEISLAAAMLGSVLVFVLFINQSTDVRLIYWVGMSAIFFTGLQSFYFANVLRDVLDGRGIADDLASLSRENLLKQCRLAIEKIDSLEKAAAHSHINKTEALNKLLDVATKLQSHAIHLDLREIYDLVKKI